VASSSIYIGISCVWWIGLFSIIRFFILLICQCHIFYPDLSLTVKSIIIIIICYHVGALKYRYCVLQLHSGCVSPEIFSW
jgi:hypothetical protein